MGYYATTTSFPQLLPYILQGNSVSDADGVAIIAAHITRAEAVVNSYIVGRYSSKIPTGGWGLPWGTAWGESATEVPPILRTITEDLASYYVIRASYVQDGQRKNEYLVSYKDALSLLEQIRSGVMPLALTDGSIVNQNTSGRYKSSTENFAPIINLDSEENWDISADQLKEITDER